MGAKVTRQGDDSWAPAESLVRGGWLCRWSGKNGEAELALAVLLEQHGHPAARQHAEITVAAAALVVDLLPRPGLAPS